MLSSGRQNNTRVQRLGREDALNAVSPLTSSAAPAVLALHTWEGALSTH